MVCRKFPRLAAVAPVAVARAVKVAKAAKAASREASKAVNRVGNKAASRAANLAEVLAVAPAVAVEHLVLRKLVELKLPDKVMLVVQTEAQALHSLQAVAVARVQSVGMVLAAQQAQAAQD